MPRSFKMQHGRMGLPLAALVRVLLVSGGARATRGLEKVWIWKYAKLPGKYTVKENVDITRDPGVSVLDDKKRVVPKNYVSTGVVERKSVVEIVEVRNIQHDFIRGRLRDGRGWITMSQLSNKKTHTVKDYVVRLAEAAPDGVDRQPDILPPQSFLDAAGYKLLPGKMGGFNFEWKYGFKEVKSLGKITWTIHGLSQGCGELIPDAYVKYSDNVAIEIENVATEKTKSTSWSMYSNRPFVLQGCSLLQGKRPAGLRFMMHINDRVAWEGSLSIEPQDLCSPTFDNSVPLSDNEGQVFIPMKSLRPWATNKIQNSVEQHLPVALWIVSYKCFSIQRTGFHLQNGDWNSLEAHLYITETSFHLLPAADGCKDYRLPFGC